MAKDKGDYLRATLRELRDQKKLADGALAQVSSEEMLADLSEESNSIAVIVKHIAGNMRSRWTDFLVSDGEKPDRNRDSEFVIDGSDSIPKLLESWEAGWALLFATLEALGPDDLGKTVHIRGRPHTVLEAVQRQLAHYASHVGQIVYVAKHVAGPRWRTLSIPRGRSGEHEERVRGGESPR